MNKLIFQQRAFFMYKVHFIQIRNQSIISSNNKLSFPEKQLSQSKQFMRTKTRTLARSQGRVVILGSGWAGFKLMRELDTQNYDVSVISPRNYFVFTPLLASTSVGTLEFRCITEPIRGYSKDINYYQAFCDKIDLENQVIHCTSNVNNDQEPKTFSLDYDKLVISVGSYSNTFGIPGVKENAYFLKDVQDARNIRKRLIECFEYASQPDLSDEEKENKLHFVVVGGGPTGIEFSAELYDFIANDLARIYPDLIDKTRMTLYDVAPKILSSFDSQLAEYAHRKFNRKGIQIKTQKFVEEVNKNHLVLKDDGKVPYGLLVWSTGLMRNPLIESFSEAKKDESGQRIVTDGRLQVIDSETGTPFSNIYALGDCSTIEGNDLPATAQGNGSLGIAKKKTKEVPVATQKSDYLCKMLNLSAKKGYEEKSDDFKFRNRGMMAYIGSSEALVDMSSVHEMAKQSGRISWLLWRSAYFSMSMNIRNRMLIAYHWFLTWSFGRDISRF